MISESAPRKEIAHCQIYGLNANKIIARPARKTGVWVALSATCVVEIAAGLWGEDVFGVGFDLDGGEA
jgi:hypothetical protein